MVESAHTATTVNSVPPWQRWGARMIDFSLLYLPSNYLAELLFSRLFPSAYLQMALPDARIVAIYLAPGILWYLLPLVMIALLITAVVLAMLMAVFGATPGKAIFGIKVRPLNGNGTFRFHLRRELAAFAAGFGCGFPLISALTMVVQRQRIALGLPASYDEDRASVTGMRLTPVREVLGAIAIIATTIGATMLTVSERGNAPWHLQTYAWQNPVTSKITAISRIWQVKSIPAAPPNRYYEFRSSRSLLSMVQFGYERWSGNNIDNASYAAILQPVVQQHFKLIDDWKPVTVGGISALRIHASGFDGLSTAIEITVAVQGRDCWQTSVYTRGKEVDDTTGATDLAEALFSTIATDQSEISALNVTSP